MKQSIQVFNFSIQNVTQDTLDVYVDGEILDASTQEMIKAWFGDETSVSYKSFRNSITQSDAKTINVFVNSPGGHVGDAMAIHDLLIELQAKGKQVNTQGRGIVASAATYIVMAGANSEMSKNSWFMIHNAGGGISGDVNTIENYARTLRKFNDSVRDFYANATGKRKEDITKMMDAETWMTAEDAKANGFIKQVTGEVAFKNAIPKEQWQYANTAVLNAYNSAVKVPQQQDDKTYFQNQLDEMKKFFTDIVNSIKGVKPAETDDKQAIVNAVADAMQAPLERVGEEIETTITNQVTAALAGDVITNAVAAAVAPFEQKIADMQAELVTMKGQPTFSNHSTPKEEKPIGSYTN